MNLIDALKVNGKATLPDLSNSSYVTEVSGFLKWVAPEEGFNGNSPAYSNIIKQDWQPYKEIKKVVIEGVRWRKDINIIPYSTRDCMSMYWPEFLNKPKMKMTLEWEE